MEELKTIDAKLNEEGFLIDTADWSPEIATAIAQRENIQLNDRHWIVIQYMRKDFQESGKSPTIRRITKNSGVETKELYLLFPVRPGSTAAKISGVPKPEGCV